MRTYKYLSYNYMVLLNPGVNVSQDNTPECIERKAYDRYTEMLNAFLFHD